MKNVGIMSMQRIVNYGSFLQAFALKSIIEELGYNVEFVDYKFEESLVKKNDTFFSKIKRNINVIDYYKKKKASLALNNKFVNDFFPLLGLSNEYNYNHDVDSLVIGSDEVFNCLQPYPVGFSKNLFGYEYENKNVISYAASFGFTTFDMIKKYNISDQLKKLLLNFNEISVRDNNSVEVVEKLIGKKPYKHLDPVLIYDYSKYVKEVDVDNYILIYAYPGRLSKKEEKYIKKFARKNHKKILSLGSYQSIADEIRIVHPLDVFSYFKHADFVITDTFHGSIFSIITNVNFCTIIRASNKNKLEDLLKTLAQQNQIISNIDEIEIKYNNPAQFDETNVIIRKERKKTLKYLEKSLDIIEEKYEQC